MRYNLVRTIAGIKVIVSDITECYVMEQLELEKLGEDWFGVIRKINGEVVTEISGQVVESMGI